MYDFGLGDLHRESNQQSCKKGLREYVLIAECIYNLLMAKQLTMIPPGVLDEARNLFQSTLLVLENRGQSEDYVPFGIARPIIVANLVACGMSSITNREVIVTVRELLENIQNIQTCNPTKLLRFFHTLSQKTP